ncbi:MAG: hypothetical protein H5T78_25720 [Nocardia sp.]|nr:hypothetical protein [Nocardia sp.]
MLVGSAGVTTAFTTLVKEWCRRDRGRRVEIRLHDNSLVLDDNPDDQLAIIERFIAAAGTDASRTADTEADPS